MKSTSSSPNIVPLPLWLFSLILSLASASAIDLRISPNGPGQLRFEWNTEIDSEYELKSSASLDSFTLWQSLSGPLFAEGTNLIFDTALPADTNGFYRVFSPYGVYPFAALTYPATNATVSGIIDVTVSAMDDSRLSAVTLFVDNVPHATLTEGLLVFRINTALYSNGVHTLKVEVQDNAGIGELGGDADAEFPVNSAESPTLTLAFDNPVRWPGADPLFETFLPITVETDIYPADWTVTVRDEAGTVVRTFSGTTTGPLITTNWNGLTQNGTNAPDLAAYAVEVFVDSGSMMSMMSGPESDGFSFAGEVVNRHGVRERVYIKQVTSPGHYEETELRETRYNSKTGQWELVRPPKLVFVPETTTILTNRIPVREELAGSKSEGGGSMMALAAGSGSVVAPSWRERFRPSGEIILARQKYKGTGLFPTLSGRYLFNITLQSWMGGDLLDLFVNTSLPGSRSVYQGSVLEMAAPGDYTQLLGAITNGQASALYYHGHSDGERVGYSEYVTSEGFRAYDVAAGLQNYYAPTNPIPTRYRFNRPFNFVFMDTCLSANGHFPVAFGIPKDVPATGYGNKKRRVFMGWTINSRNTLVDDNNNFAWTKRFFDEWLSSGDGTRPLGEAVDAANAAYPNVTGSGALQIYGTRALQWRD